MADLTEDLFSWQTDYIATVVIDFDHMMGLCIHEYYAGVYSIKEGVKHLDLFSMLPFFRHQLLDGFFEGSCLFGHLPFKLFFVSAGNQVVPSPVNGSSNLGHKGFLFNGLGDITIGPCLYGIIDGFGIIQGSYHQHRCKPDSSGIMMSQSTKSMKSFFRCSVASFALEARRYWYPFLSKTAPKKLRT